MTEFLLLAVLAGLGVAVVAGPLGAFVVWRRMAYFGDTLAHSALLGLALSLLASISPALAVVITSLALALLLIGLQQQRVLATDTLLGILSHSSLALGLVALYLIPGARFNLEAILFGDLFTVDWPQLALIWGTAVAVLGLLALLWRPLLAITLHEDLARVEGIRVGLVRGALMLMLALVIAIAMKVVGVLLITALLIIPAATARRFSRSPESMALLASGLACTTVLAGLAFSWWFDTPSGPSIVLCSALIFMGSLLRREI